MKYYYLAVTIIATGLFTIFGYSDYLRSQKQLKELEIKKIELLIKLKEK